MDEKEKNLVDYSFALLQDVAQENTKWSIVYDITNKRIFFRTDLQYRVKECDLSVFDWSCKSLSKAWPLENIGYGNISNLFVDYTGYLNEKLVKKSFEESMNQFTISDEQRDRIIYWTDQSGGYDRLARNYLASVCLAAAIVWWI